jgi:multicomponent Na+:H+ antiporter subunit D
VSLELATGLAPLLPVLGALGVIGTGRWPQLRESVTLGTGVITFACVLWLVPSVAAGARPELLLIEVFPGIALRLAVEPLGMLFALVASGLWIVTSVYSIGYMRAHGEANQTRFYAYFAVSIAAALGVAFSANLFTLFLFYEALTLSTYPLVTHRGTDEARRGGRTYLGLLLSTSIGFLLLAIVWTWQLTGTLEFQPGGILAGHVEGGQAMLLLALFAFGIGKAALMPFHRWLPAAMVAPTPVSALLHAVAVVKAGVFAILKVTIYVFGIDFLRAGDLSAWLTYVAAATILIASVVALTRDNLKERLAYSTVSQLSYIVLGAALATSSSVLGGGLHIAMHAVGKITLFFCAGAIEVALHKKNVSELHGIGRQMPFTMAAFAIASLSIIGLPPLGGAWSKWYLALGAAEGGHFLLLAVLMLSSLLSVGYLMPIVARAFFAPPADRAEPGQGLREAPLLCVLPLCATALGSLALFFFAPEIYAFLEPLVGDA